MRQFIFIFGILFVGMVEARNENVLENPVVFPSGFLKGVAYSTYQNSGHNYWPSLKKRPISNWTWFENKVVQNFRIDRRKSLSHFMQSASPIDYGQKVGISADTWQHMFDDIKLIKKLGANTLRLEIPWTDLQPKKGMWNEQAFQLFDRYIDALIENGIKPMITLYHWVHPKWFQDLGGWEKSENIAYFVNYCKEVFKRFGHKVHYWCTINEPTVVSCCGYIMGSHAPGVQDDFNKAGLVLGHLLKAHVCTYTALKRMPHGDKSQICLVHQCAKFEALNRTYLKPLNSISKLMAAKFQRMFAHEVVMHFFKTGEFKYQIDKEHTIGFVDKRAPKSLDFIGLNFYADVLLGPWPTSRPGETMTDMIWAIRPNDFYNAIKEIASLGVPIIVTENGIPDAKDDRREQWITRYTNALKKAIDDGYDVRGYYYWSLLDNYEWNMGHDKKFGLYEVDTASSDPNAKTRCLRDGAKAYRDYFKVADDQTMANHSPAISRAPSYQTLRQ